MNNAPYTRIFSTVVISGITGCLTDQCGIPTIQRLVRSETLSDFCILLSKFLLLLIILLLTFAGLFVETTVVALLMTPILLPVVQSVGVEPVHFGVLMMTVVTGGIMTPPVGIALYTTSEIMGCKPQETARVAVPFYIAMLTVILIIAFIPQVTMFLPNLVYR